MPLTQSLGGETKRLLARGAGRAFEHTVRQIYNKLGGEPSRDSPVALVQKLLVDGKVTAEAALYLITLGNALQQAGAFRLVPEGGVRAMADRLHTVRQLLR